MFRPVLDFLMVEECDEESPVLMLPDNYQFEWVTAKVIHAGPGRRNGDGVLIPNLYKPGDVVVFAGKSAIRMKLNNVPYMMIGANNVLCVETENE